MCLMDRLFVTHRIQKCN